MSCCGKGARSCRNRAVQPEVPNEVFVCFAMSSPLPAQNLGHVATAELTASPLSGEHQVCCSISPNEITPSTGSPGNGLVTCCGRRICIRVRTRQFPGLRLGYAPRARAVKLNSVVADSANGGVRYLTITHCRLRLPASFLRMETQIQSPGLAGLVFNDCRHSPRDAPITRTVPTRRAT